MECHYAWCCYAECHYAECRYAECGSATLDLQKKLPEANALAYFAAAQATKEKKVIQH